MENIIDITQARINMYGFLSRLFIEEIDPFTLQKIKENEDLLELFPNTKQWDKFKEKDIMKLIEEDLNVDYTTLFILNVYPYESVFVNDEGHINPTITNPTLVFYREHGYAIDLNKTRALSPDHIGVELEFMMNLIQDELNAIAREDEEKANEYRKIQKKFLEEHLANWGLPYLLAIKDIAETPFYYDVADATLEFLMSDLEYLNEKLESQVS
ncbi:TorD/DmsD family molecular chaperone [Hydrogenothermus marinus]|uniref:TorA maturation chaperone TorD n=1 Tax=Hydrogenothermus marinus TaxID=133270 RepID=A0A3M0BGK8_9AQUI|nr:molecular chaperone TorD family protein [Hydrogenothermus marinus]RMA96157.1 TorA maturation chaperone TorD [Hydrogenothermus marinus]